MVYTYSSHEIGDLMRQAMTMRYAFVTSRALRSIARLRAQTPLPDYSFQAFELAENLLLEMRRGTALIIGSQGALGYSAESIPAATLALRVIDALSMASEASDIQELLTRLQETLGSVRASESCAELQAEVELPTEWHSSCVVVDGAGACEG